MADGDIAASLGWSVPAGTEDKRNGWQRIAQALDKIASHIISGTHAWTAITGKPTYFPYDPTLVIAGNIPSDGPSSVQGDINALKSGLLNVDSYNRFISGTFRSLVIQSDGTLGQRSTSSRRYKANIRPAPIDWSVLLRDPRAEPVAYVRRKELARVKKEGGEPQQEVGWIAELLAELGMPFVGDDEKGRPDVVHYEEAGPAILGAVRALALEVDDLRTRLDKAGI